MRCTLNKPAPEVPERFYISNGKEYRYLANKNAVQHPIHPDINGALLGSFRSREYVIFDPVYSENHLVAVSTRFGRMHDQMIYDNYKFFINTDCDFFPCHAGIPKDSFNCLFCYCPLYPLGDKCDGNFSFDADGTKDCSGCAIPHDKANYELIIKHLRKK